MWQIFRSGGLGVGPLPFPGGSADQPACVIAAFRIMTAAADALKPPREDSGG